MLLFKIVDILLEDILIDNRVIKYWVMGLYFLVVFVMGGVVYWFFLIFNLIVMVFLYV